MDTGSQLDPGVRSKGDFCVEESMKSRWSPKKKKVRIIFISWRHIVKMLAVKRKGPEHVYSDVVHTLGIRTRP